MSPKISKAKTPPWRKPDHLPFLPLLELFSPGLCSLPSFKRLFRSRKITTLPTSARCEPLCEICISALFPLSACSKFEHAYGGIMCLWSPREPLWGVVLSSTPSSTTAVFSFLLYFFAIISSFPPVLCLCISITISISFFLTVRKSQHYRHTYKCLNAAYASTRERTHKRIRAQIHNHEYIDVQTHKHRQ